MRQASWKEERRLLSEGFEQIAGLDEAGKGAWAGPLVAAAVILPPKIKISGIRDSKQLNPSQRKQLYLEITKQATNWSVGMVAEAIIDKIGIVEANLLAMKKALERLLVSPDYLLIDYVKLSDFSTPQMSITDGDQKVASIAAASIVAKVTRDVVMIAYHERYPKFGFDRHKGYGTDKHYQNILRYGICDIHRKSFAPIKHILSKTPRPTHDEL